MLTNNETCTCEIESSIAMTKAAFISQRAIFTSKMDLELRKKPVKSYSWSIDLHGAKTWTLLTVDQKNLVVSKCGVGEGWRRSVGPTMRDMKNYYLE
jgi:hypothetical protein